MKLFGFAFILWIIVYVYGIYKHGIKDVILQHKVFINCLLLVVTVILFAFGCYTNVIYSSKCKIGERVDGVISSRDFSPGSRSAEWYYEYEIDITDEDTHVTAYSIKYYK